MLDLNPTHYNMAWMWPAFKLDIGTYFVQALS